MKQRNALIAAAGFTAFVLVVIGGLAGRLSSASATVPSPTVDPALMAQIQDREAAYQNLVQQANDRLQQAYEQLGQVQKQAQSAQMTTTYPVSPDLAAGLALSLAPGAKLTSVPALVDFQGTVAYEVILDRGSMYIDATTGRLLYDGMAPIMNSVGTFGDEYEGGEYDD